MPSNDAVIYTADWWPIEGADAEDAGIEVERTDPDEVMVSIRGFKGTDDQGSFYVTARNARLIARALLDAASAAETETP